MISEASDRLQMAQEACLDGDILTSFEPLAVTELKCVVIVRELKCAAIML